MLQIPYEDGHGDRAFDLRGRSATTPSGDWITPSCCGVSPVPTVIRVDVWLVRHLDIAIAAALADDARRARPGRARRLSAAGPVARDAALRTAAARSRAGSAQPGRALVGDGPLLLDAAAARQADPDRPAGRARSACRARAGNAGTGRGSAVEDGGAPDGVAPARAAASVHRRGGHARTSSRWPCACWRRSAASSRCASRPEDKQRARSGGRTARSGADRRRNHKMRAEFDKAFREAREGDKEHA